MLKVLLALLLLFSCLSGSSAAVAAERTVLKLAMYHSPPYYFTEHVAEPRGLSLDLLKPASRELGVSIEVIVCPFARCLKMAELGEVDIMAGLIKTAERESFLHFLQPAMMNFQSSFAFYGQQNNPNLIDSVSDLQGHSVAVMRHAVYFPEFDQADYITRVFVSSEAVALDMVHKGRVDYAITVEQTAAGSFGTAGLALSDLKRQPYHFEQQIRGYLAFSRKSPHFALAAPLEHLLEQHYKAGLFHLLWQKYHLPAIRSQATRYAAEPSAATPAE